MRVIYGIIRLVADREGEVRPNVGARYGEVSKWS